VGSVGLRSTGSGLRSRAGAAFAALALAMLLAEPGAATEPPRSEALKGFGNIPFGASSDDALKLNNGNGALAKSGDRIAALVYMAVVAGLDFQVVQNFDANGRATKATLSYNSVEQPNACVGRFDYVLNLLTSQYGKPTSAPAARHEEIGATAFDYYPFEFAMKENSGIKAQLEVSYPKRVASDAKAAAKGNAQAAASPGCKITLDYLPPGWVTHL
jgi:hypothetical protein